ncbi:hypothetical protein HMPREF9628_01643 [Peptoanaerobacter stomatis]|uniref:Uncharacterized protein n=1 Tax=Peptoanaerobacter stomatis TaxID=796937 RepID=G9XCR6_9FIRM|nr:hypothetical protein HMPREF9628_01643 [Peptoanaerobacter stomatis]
MSNIAGINPEFTFQYGYFIVEAKEKYEEMLINIYIPVWLFYSCKKIQMVNVGVDLFTFQYGYFIVSASSKSSISVTIFTFQYGYFIVTPIPFAMFCISAFTFQYGYFIVNNIYNAIISNINIYIPIWLFYSTVNSTDLPILDAFTFQYGYFIVSITTFS